MGHRRLITAWVMLASLLAFSLEPLTGRMVLPRYGGSAHVWNVTMMVFQGLLLLGYAYAHGPGRRIGRFHIAVLVLPLFFLPIDFGGSSAPHSPVLALSAQLLRDIGVPFLVLTTTAVMAQTWWTRSSLASQGEPYPLYAASNVGSLIALLAYPVLIEPAFGLGTQRWLWTIAYLFFIAIGAYAWVSLRPGGEARATPAPQSESVAPAGRSRVAYWFALSAIPSLLLLAVTNKVAFEIGSFPLVWVIPLALYLASFVVAFRSGTAWRGVDLYWPEIVCFLALSSVLMHRLVFLVAFQILFFLLCVAMHRELFRRRPAPSSLTSFYLVMAAGGWVGGMFVALAAPLVFDRYRELPLGMVAAAIVLTLATRDRLTVWTRYRPRKLLVARGALFVLMAVVGATIVQAVQSMAVLARARSFYGGYEIRRSFHDGEPYLVMVNGGTVHGLQWESEELRSLSTSYYHEGGPIDEALQLRPPGARIGVIGLGAGVNAADLKPGEELVYYEIDHMSSVLAHEWFTFLADAPGKVPIREGDARLLLANEGGTGDAGAAETAGGDDDYDVLLVDAFSGDGVPVHLLTVEALDAYRSRLKDGGFLVFHISNRYNDLRGVLKANAERTGLAGAWKTGRTETPMPLDAVARVVVLADYEATIQPLYAEGWRAFGPGDGVPNHRAWTDDYINILQPIAARFFDAATNDLPPGVAQPIDKHATVPSAP